MVSRDDDFLLFSVQRCVYTLARRQEGEKAEARLLGDVGDDKGNTWNVIRRSELDNTAIPRDIKRNAYK